MKRREFLIFAGVMSLLPETALKALSGEEKWEWWVTPPSSVHLVCPKARIDASKDELEQFLTENFNYTGPLEGYVRRIKQRSEAIFEEIRREPLKFSGKKEVIYEGRETLAVCYNGNGFEIRRIIKEKGAKNHCFQIESNEYLADITVKPEEGKLIVPQFSEALDGEIFVERKALLSDDRAAYHAILTMGRPRNPDDIEIVEVPLRSIRIGSGEYEKSIEPYMKMAGHLFSMPNLNERYRGL